MKLSSKPIIIGFLLMLVLSFPMGIVTVQLYDYFLNIHGLSYENSKIDRIYEILSRYDYHPYMLLLYIFSSIVTVSIPAFVAAYLSKSNRILHGMMIGLLSVLLFLASIGSFDSIKFILLIVSIDLITALLGSAIGKRIWKKRYE